VPEVWDEDELDTRGVERADADEVAAVAVPGSGRGGGDRAARSATSRGRSGRVRDEPGSGERPAVARSPVLRSPMDLDDARGVIREQHRAVLATTRNDGTPHMSPVPVAVDDDGCALVSTRETAAKVGNLRRDPRSWLCVLPDGFFGRWVQVEGRGEIVYLPEAMDGLEDYYRRVAGEHDYRAAMRRERRVLLRIALDRAGPDRAG
jgi:PPOX class probable F420-dependent enzyme